MVTSNSISFFFIDRQGEYTVTDGKHSTIYKQRQPSSGVATVMLPAIPFGN